MSESPKPCLDNPEKLMLLLFPLITFALFVAGAVLWWVFSNAAGSHPGF